MASKTTTRKPAAPKTEAAQLDLHALLLDALAAKSIEPRVKWAPSKNYCSLYVDGKNIGYVFKQTSRGIRVEPAASMADLPKTVKGFKAGTRSERFALVGFISDAAGVGHAAGALAIAAAKQAKPAAKKADGSKRA